MFRAKVKFITSLFLLSLVLLTVTQASTRAQETSHTFTETGRTVSGIFLQYWHSHGGLPQQGYPISDEMILRSTDGKEYKTQFFERAVFEHHPEYAGTENEVLLKLVGQTFYDRHFGNTPPPNQSVNPANTYTFQETGHAVGGKFRAYWEAHGGLAQQGYPMTDEFRMVSTDGKEYATQVFQRAVFELHPEYAGTENEVLLRLLGVEELAELNKPESTPTPAVTPTPPQDEVLGSEDYQIKFTTSQGQEGAWTTDNSKENNVPLLSHNTKADFQADFKELLKRTMNPNLSSLTYQFDGYDGSTGDVNGWNRFSFSEKNSDGTRDGGISGISQMEYRQDPTIGEYELIFHIKYRDPGNIARLMRDPGLKAAYSSSMLFMAVRAGASEVGSTDYISRNDSYTKIGTDSTGYRLAHLLGLDVPGYPQDIRNNPWEAFVTFSPH